MTRFAALGVLSFACVGLVGNVGCKRAKQDAPTPASTVKKTTLDDVIADIKLNESDPLHGLFQDVADKQWASIRDSFQKLAPGSTVQTPE